MMDNTFNLYLVPSPLLDAGTLLPPSPAIFNVVEDSAGTVVTDDSGNVPTI